MQASTDFLIALSIKLTEIADNTADIETAAELEKLIRQINERSLDFSPDRVWNEREA
ncbi:hypothetical protein [Bacillus toyonensis]|uniref:hypothetical protein n=1 Tax=Bacillus toyonensis TaxID=155322 RepID=UPI0015D4E17B|nr:hypothetical protein [Bacillus toyonensis]